MQDIRLFKFIILATLILIFIAVATTKIWELRIAAERVGVAHTLGSLRSALGMKLGEAIMEEGVAALARLHHSNPMLLWNPPPSNYLGEFHNEQAPETEGAWYFDSDLRTLNYRLLFGDYVDSDHLADPGLLQFRVDLGFDDLNNNKQYDPATENVTGIDIVSVYPYRWKEER